MIDSSSQAQIRRHWQETEVYKWDKSQPRDNNFIIDTPPPTVSGKLHIGHIFSYTHIDFIARFQRMIGKNVFYPIGFDDNGLPTERLVEKHYGIKASSLSRQEFIKLCQEVIKIEEERFKELFEIMGYSFDWDLAYQTISPSSAKISQLSFLDLLKKGQIYRKSQPVLWDYVDQTALAQAEIQDKEQTSMMNYINFSLPDGSKLEIATTRPELLGACVAVLVHPDDKRYENLVGQKVASPLFNAQVQVIADQSVLMEKGSGAVMCCTFGDASDVAWWERYKLETKIIIDKSGRLIPVIFDEQTSLSPELANQHYAKLCGLKIKDAREQIIQMLKETQDLVRQEEVVQKVKCAERSGAPLEILITKQWFIKTLDHKQKLLELASELNWYPKYMQNRLETWISGLSWDWCISRQRFFGIPFPVWYSKRLGEEGRVLLPDLDNLPVDPLNDLPKGYAKDEVIADSDVMDTWATSCVSPQINSMAINDQFAHDLDMHKKVFPADLRPQAHEIIRIWAFGTILKSYLHEGVLPWKNIMISGWCLAQDKTKMSKSKGNIIEPMNLIELHGVDSLRYWASTSKAGSDTSYSQDVVLNGKRLVNKLKNAAKFAKLHFANFNFTDFDINKALADDQIFCISDLWLLNTLNKVIDEARNSFTEFDFFSARDVVEKFFWQDFCDIYLELIKTRIYNDKGQDLAAQTSAIYTLYHSLQVLLKLFAPFVPYVTEELWLDIFNQKSSIHAKNNWPNKIKIIFDQSASYQRVIFDIINEVRKEKTKKQLSIKAPVKLIELFDVDVNLPGDLINDLVNVTCAEQILINYLVSDKILSKAIDTKDNLGIKITF